MTHPSERELSQDIDDLRDDDGSDATMPPLVAYLDSETDDLYENEQLTGDPLDDDVAEHVIMAIEPRCPDDDDGVTYDTPI